MTAFDIGPDGALTNRREWARFGPPRPRVWECVPDGIAMDAEGAVWMAGVEGGRVARVREGGEILDEIGTVTTPSPAPWAARTDAPCTSA